MSSHGGGDPALDVLNRALNGDHSALSFLERTTSIYVLDATDPSKPKTYGGWNFIHQAMNEIERNEAEQLRIGGAVDSTRLVGHVQLLATMAQRVARRSPSVDRKLIQTCVSNASQYHYNYNTANAQTLIDLNSEIREIVMGRIAAMAFDFSFHKSSGQSAFSDPVSMEKLCSVLAANAVTTGPVAVNHFMREWIIPCVSTLPSFAVACVTHHLAIEASSKSAPAGTKDAMQHLSHPVVGAVIIPVLSDAIAETAESPNHSWNCRVAASCLNALDRWCVATDLSLPQINHICTKFKMKFISVLSDALYSDSDLVVDAMAELIDNCIDGNGKDRVTHERMTQARYIMEVDEEIFRTITPEDLYRIEAKEMEELLGELVSAIGLQRFRFSERQVKGDNGICRNLTRIAARVGAEAMDGLVTGRISGGGSGMLELLMKATTHRNVHISSLAIEVLTDFLPLDPSFPSRMLPLLQHRAIIPYVLYGTVPSLGASTSSGVDFAEFENFRQNVLADALVACYLQNPKYYMDSCSSAVEEFCSSHATVEVSFQLEAALYCLTTVAMTATTKRKGQVPQNHNDQMSRCTLALSTKPAFLPANPLALGQLNRFLGVYGRWYATEALTNWLEVAFELSLSTVKMAATSFSDKEPASDMLKEMDVSPFSEAAKALRIILTRSPTHFKSPGAIVSLGSAWESTYVAYNRGMLTIEDREELFMGICAVVVAFPESQREKPYHAFALPVVQCVHMLTKEADDARSVNDEKLSAVISRLAEEIRLLSTMVSAFTAAARKIDSEMENGKLGRTVMPSLMLLKELWPCLTHTSTNYASDQHLGASLGVFLVSCIPHDLESDESIGLIRELFKLSNSMFPENKSSKASLLAACEFVQRVVELHGSVIDDAAKISLDHSIVRLSAVEFASEMGQLFEGLLLTIIGVSKSSLGSAWTRDIEQMPNQQSFESRPKSKLDTDVKPSSTEVLSAVLEILNACAKNCPTVLICLPATPGGDAEHDRLLSRAVDSAVSALLEPNFEVARTSILFLKSTIELSTSTLLGGLRGVLQRCVSPFRGSIVSQLIAGVCGLLLPTLLDPAASLLYTILRASGDDARRFYENGLKQDQFKLGNVARASICDYLARCSSGLVSLESLMEVSEKIWGLHQHNENDSVTESDQVVDFIQKLG